MRIGFVCLQSPDDPSNVSGMLYAVKQQLAKRAEVINVMPSWSVEQLQQKRAKSRIKGLLPSAARAAQVRAEEIFAWDHFGARVWEIVEDAASRSLVRSDLPVA